MVTPRGQDPPGSAVKAGKRGWKGGAVAAVDATDMLYQSAAASSSSAPSVVPMSCRVVPCLPPLSTSRRTMADALPVEQAVDLRTDVRSTAQTGDRGWVRGRPQSTIGRPSRPADQRRRPEWPQRTILYLVLSFLRYVDVSTSQQLTARSSTLSPLFHSALETHN